MKKFHVVFWPGLAALTLSACHPKAQFKESNAVQPVAARSSDEEPSLRGGFFQEVAGVQTVHFDYDSAALRSDARGILSQNSKEIGKHSKWTVLVEGHCDDRGTTAYNLALGQRRAAAVRQYYVALGLPASRIATISYGKEKPVCTESTEDCWAQNRRAVTKVALKSEAPKNL